jgi:hypothetical protein
LVNTVRRRKEGREEEVGGWGHGWPTMGGRTEGMEKKTTKIPEYEKDEMKGVAERKRVEEDGGGNGKRGRERRRVGDTRARACRQMAEDRIRANRRLSLRHRQNDCSLWYGKMPTRKGKERKGKEGKNVKGLGRK